MLWFYKLNIVKGTTLFILNYIHKLPGFVFLSSGSTIISSILWLHKENASLILLYKHSKRKHRPDFFTSNSPLGKSSQKKTHFR